MNELDILFLLETHCNCTSMPVISGFRAIGDPKFPLTAAHGGIVVYIKNNIYDHMQRIRFSRCCVSFNFTFAPKIVFIGVYVYPYDSLNFTESDFATLVCEIKFWISGGFVPFIGGDFNARVGDLNVFSSRSIKWRYEPNVDKYLNQHGKELIDICELLKMLPINHSKYYDTIFAGNFTYFKAEKKSQIDFLITNDNGRRLLTHFEIPSTGWHISDHLPLHANILIKTTISADMLLKRSNELKPYIPSQQPLLRTHHYKFNEATACDNIMSSSIDL